MRPKWTVLDTLNANANFVSYQFLLEAFIIASKLLPRCLLDIIKLTKESWFWCRLLTVSTYQLPSQSDWTPKFCVYVRWEHTSSKIWDIMIKCIFETKACMTSLIRSPKAPINNGMRCRSDGLLIHAHLLQCQSRSTLVWYWKLVSWGWVWYY